MGLMELTVSSASKWSDPQLELSITGQAANSQTWVMVYTYPIINDVQIEMVPALIRNKGKRLQPLHLIYTHLAPAKTVQIKFNDQTRAVSANYGINQFEFLLPEVQHKTYHQLELITSTQKFSRSFHQKPVRKWTAYLVQHTHTDIGYTRPQQGILAEHLRYIDYALDYCDLTDSLPDAAKFRWTCEASWPIREYLLSRSPEQIERLKKRVAEGRIELTGMMFNMSELADENLLAALLEPIKTIKSFGIPVRTAMQNDVNGFAWALLDYFADLGIHYISMGENTHRALKPFPFPTPFWWKTKSGNKVLAFRADHYMVANFVANQAGDLNSVDKDMFAYLEKLEQSGYPYNEVEMQHSGYFIDNSPPSTFASEMVKKWNAKYEYPRLCMATITDFMQLIERKYGNQLPEYQLAWPDWWADGFGSAARETAVARQTESDLIMVQGLLSLARLMHRHVPDPMIDQLKAIDENLLFWCEHTFGAAESISDPLSENSINQWMIKASFPWKAQWQTYLLEQKALGLLQPLLERGEKPNIYVFNTLNWRRSGLANLYIDKQLLPSDKQFRLLDEQGNVVPMQILKQRAEGNYWVFLTNDLPPLGWKKFTLQVSLNSQSPWPTTQKTVLENEFYRLDMNLQKGAIERLMDKQLGRNLVDFDAAWSLGAFI